MKEKEVSEIEYREIIIPLLESELENDLRKISNYVQGSLERKALIIAAKLRSLHIQYLYLYLDDLAGSSDKIQEKIKENKKLEIELRTKFDKVGLDVREL